MSVIGSSRRFLQALPLCYQGLTRSTLRLRVFYSQLAARIWPASAPRGGGHTTVETRWRRHRVYNLLPPVHLRSKSVIGGGLSVSGPAIIWLALHPGIPFLSTRMDGERILARRRRFLPTIR